MRASPLAVWAPAAHIAGTIPQEAAVRETIRRIFAERMAPPAEATTNGRPHDEAELRAEQQRLHVAACALLLELAYADDDFSDAERAHIGAILQRHFAMDPETAETLIELAEAERSRAIDLYQFTSLVRDSYDMGQKTLLAEIMWGLVLADGQIARHEGYMLRKIANLLDLEPGYLAFARRNVEGGLT
jgi:uncharacterized tellurite resistance protein B-like protein